MALWLHSKWGTTPINTRNHQEIAKREVSVDVWNRIGNPGEDDRRLSGESEIKSHDPRASVWLYGSDKWNKTFPEGWEGIRVLGTGGFGIAGHWQYRGYGPHNRGLVEAQIRDIVVKQSSAVENHGLVDEAFTMAFITKTGSKHTPQLYGGLHRDVGRQDRVAVDQKRREVHRIFMEYCDGGSLEDHIETSYHFNDLTSEETMWAYFHCLAKAIVVMEHGHEMDSDSRFLQMPPWVDFREIVHFDMKPDNTLITQREGSGEHLDNERIVVADFGLSKCLENERRIGRPVKEHDQILDAYASLGTVDFRAPEQVGLVRRANRRYGACTNIYQVGCIMFCLIMQTSEIPIREPPAITSLTDNKRYHTIGRDELEVVGERSRALRGLVAECMFVEPAHRPTGVELLRRTRAGLQRYRPWAAQASKLYEKLTPVKSLLLDQWFGEKPSLKFPERIPEMQRVVDLRKRQLHQIERAKRFDRDRRRAAEKAGAGGKQGGNPPPGAGGNQGGNPPAGPAGGQNPPPKDNNQGAPPGEEANGADEGQRHFPKRDPVKPANKPWPGEKFARPIHILHLDPPRQPRNPPVAKEPPVTDWDRVTKAVKGPTGGHVPRPKKRPSQRPPPAAPPAKRSRGIEPVPGQQVEMVNQWLHGVNLNRETPLPKPVQPDQNFLMPVRIWPGPQPSLADEAFVHLRNFNVPIDATLSVLIRLMWNDASTGIKAALRYVFAMPGTTTELPRSTSLADMGYGPAPRVRRGYLECFRTILGPGQVFGPGGVARSFPLTVHMQQMQGVEPRLTLQVGYQMRILRLKEAIIEADMHPDFRHPSQLRLHYIGDDPQGKDFPDHRTIRSFFEGKEEEGRQVVFCSLRPIGQGGSGKGSARWFKPIYTPPNRNQRRFL